MGFVFLKGCGGVGRGLVGVGGRCFRRLDVFWELCGIGVGVTRYKYDVLGGVEGGGYFVLLWLFVFYGV